MWLAAISHQTGVRRRANLTSLQLGRLSIKQRPTLQQPTCTYRLRLTMFELFRQWHLSTEGL